MFGRYRHGPLLLAGAALLACTASAFAIIQALLPLEAILSDAELVLVAKVAKIDAGQPLVVLTVQEDLKGKAPFRRLAVNFKGDADAKKHKQVPQLMKRLAHRFAGDAVPAGAARQDTQRLRVHQRHVVSDYRPADRRRRSARVAVDARRAVPAAHLQGHDGRAPAAREGQSRRQGEAAWRQQEGTARLRPGASGEEDRSRPVAIAGMDCIRCAHTHGRPARSA